MRAPSYFRVLGAALALGLAMGVAPTTVEARGEVRLRVEVDDAETGEQRVRLNIPLTSIEGLLDMVGDEFDFDLDQDWMREASARGVGLREIYLAVRDEDLSDFLEVTDEDGEHVKVWKDAEAFHVRVQEAGRSEPNVRLYLPLAVMDALLLQGDTPDFQAALDALKALAPLTLVEVDDDDEVVRIWLE